MPRQYLNQTIVVEVVDPAMKEMCYIPYNVFTESLMTLSSGMLHSLIVEYVHCIYIFFVCRRSCHFTYLYRNEIMCTWDGACH